MWYIFGELDTTFDDDDFNLEALEIGNVIPVSLDELFVSILYSKKNTFIIYSYKLTIIKILFYINLGISSSIDIENDGVGITG